MMPAWTKKSSCAGFRSVKGSASASPFFSPAVDEEIPEVAIPKKEIEQEIDRYRRALDLSRQDVEKLQKISFNEGPPEIVAILGTHLEMMQDPLMTSVIEERIRDKQQKYRIDFPPSRSKNISSALAPCKITIFKRGCAISSMSRAAF